MDVDSVSCHFYGTHHMSLIECKVQGKQAPPKKRQQSKVVTEERQGDCYEEDICLEYFNPYYSKTFYIHDSVYVGRMGKTGSFSILCNSDFFCCIPSELV